MLPLRRLLFIVGLPGFLIFGTIAMSLSRPIEELAADLRNREMKPIWIAISVLGLLIGLELLVTVAAGRATWLDVRVNDERTDGDFVLDCLSVAVLAATAWGLWQFIVAQQSIAQLRADRVGGFDVVTGEQLQAGPTSAPVTVLPPRPKR